MIFLIDLFCEKISRDFVKTKIAKWLWSNAGFDFNWVFLIAKMMSEAI